MTDDARRRILDRIREANAGRDPAPHPGAFPGGDTDLGGGSVVRLFAGVVEAAGGEVVELAGEGAAARWIRGFAGDFATAAVSPEVGDALDPGLPPARASVAELGVSRAVGGAADTGTVLLSSREGRSLQLLPATHLVVLARGRLHETLTGALEAARTRLGEDGAGAGLPSAIGLHSGPSKSADIGRIVVTGVHGPGRLVVALVGDGAPPEGSLPGNETEPGTGP